MQTIRNDSATLYHLPGKYGPKGASKRDNGKPAAAVAIAPEATIVYDLEGLFEDRPGLRRSLEGLVIVSSARAPAVPVPAPLPAFPEPASAGARVPPWAVGRSDSYVAITTAEAALLIADERDIDELRAWRAVETRKGVQSLLDERAKVLTSEG